MGDWYDAIGVDPEKHVYHHELDQLGLHQFAITNVAFAVVPWLLEVCRESHTQYKLESLTEIALVEANRLTRGAYHNRPETEAMPTWLMTDYLRAIEESQPLAEGRF